MANKTGLLVGVLMVLCAGIARGGVPPELVFTDITVDAGIGEPDALNESVAWGDYDNDGDLDLYLTNNGPNKLFRNEGGGVFLDVTAVVGVGNALFSVGTAFGDLDNDGDLDLYVVNFGVGTDVLYRNDGPTGVDGEYQYTDVTADAGTTVEVSSRGVALLDYDHDGLLDIFVNAVGPQILYHNLGDLQFEDVAPDLGVDDNVTGVGVVCTDIDNNGWVDLFVGNRSNKPNRLYTNLNGIFEDITVSAGIDQSGLGMGVLAFDHDNDLDIDLYWTVWPGDPPQSNALYSNIDGTTFLEIAGSSGTGNLGGWGISCNAGDIDNDGFEDFCVTNGFSDTTTPNVLFYNKGDGTFADTTSVLGGGDFDGRGVAFADFDGDGDLDICVTADAGDSTRLWRNDTPGNNHWISVELVGVCSNRSGIGARVEVTTDLMNTVKEVSGGAGRGSQNSLPVEFGLGASTIVEEITIRWPSGTVQTVSTLAVDQHMLITEDCQTPSSVEDPTQSPVAGPGDLQGANGSGPHLTASPNPIWNGTTLTLELPHADGIELKIYDAAGRVVRSLAAGSYEQGTHRFDWDAKDNEGRAVGAGVYFARSRVGKDYQETRVTVVR